MLVDKKRYLLREEEDALAEKYCSECKKPFCAFCDTEVEDADIEQPRWISCSERLPLTEGVYIVTGRNGTVSRFLFSDTDASKKYWHRAVLAWMPLPKPYVGENDGKN